MSIELVTGRAGKPHVSSDDVAGLLRAAMGAGSYVLGATLPKISMSNANTCAISPAELLLSGRHVKLTGTNSITVESGGQATYRIDYICVRYKRDISLGIESAELVEIKGEPAASKDEAVAPNIPLAPEINATSQQVDVPIIRIDVDRLTPACTWVIPTVSSLSALMDASPVTLYSNPSPDPRALNYGARLSEPASRFKRMTIEYCTNDLAYDSVTVDDPDGKRVVLHTIDCVNGETMVLKAKTVIISGTDVNTIRTDMNKAYWTGELLVPGGSAPTAGDRIGITRVLGWRR